MGCDTTKDIQRLFSGQLAEDERLRLTGHLADCKECRSELAFLAAVRLSLPEQPEGRAGNDCISDEMLALLYDGALEGEEQERALFHLARCDRCLGAWLALDRSLADAASRPASVPASLVSRALGTHGTSWFGRLFSGNIFARLAVAGSAAAAVFALVVTLSPGPTEQPEPVPVQRAGQEQDLKLAKNDGQTPRTGAASVDARRDDSSAGQKGPGAPTTTRAPHTSDAIAHNTFTESLDGPTRQRLFSRLGRPWTRNASLVSALSTAGGSPAVEGYLAGRAAQAFGILSKYQDEAGARTVTANILKSLAAELKLSRRQDAARLTAFAADLGDKISAGKIEKDSSVRRLKVFVAALSEDASAEKAFRAGLELGKLTGELTFLATAQLNGITPPQKSWPDKESIARIRKLIEQTKAIDPKARGALDNLVRMLPAAGGKQGPDSAKAASDRSARILEDIEQIDRNIRSTR